MELGKPSLEYHAFLGEQGIDWDGRHNGVYLGYTHADFGGMNASVCVYSCVHHDNYSTQLPTADIANNSW